MVRFLSKEWFERAVGHPSSDPPAEDRLVIEEVVRGTPDGDVRYLVIVENGAARIERPGESSIPSDLTITSDWATASEIAQGRLSTQRALLDGKLRIRGDLAQPALDTGRLVGLDPLPSGLRDATEY